MKRAIPVCVLVLVTAIACTDGESPTAVAVETGPISAAEGTASTVPDRPRATVTTTEAALSTSRSDLALQDVSCDEPIRVGVMTDLTGALSIYGAHIMRSFPLGMEYATGAPGEDDTYVLGDCPIEVIYRDDRSDTEAAITMARELIDIHGADIIVGSVSPQVTAGIQELALQNGVVHIATPTSANSVTGATFNPNSFRTSRNTYQDAVSLCEYLSTKHDTYVQIAPDYTDGREGARILRDACTRLGAEFIGDDIFAPLDTTDFNPYLEPVLDSGADAWIVSWAGGGFIPMMDAAASLGVRDQTAVGTRFLDNALMPVFFADLLGTTSGIAYHYTLPDNEINDWLVARTLETANTHPDLFDADGMNAALLIVEALEGTGGDATAEALRSAMEGLTYWGPKGEIEIRAEDHVAIQDMYIATLQNLDDPEQRFFELIEVNRPTVPCLLRGEYADRCGDLPVDRAGD